MQDMKNELNKNILKKFNWNSWNENLNLSHKNLSGKSHQ
jgi:hypothetical protein